MTEQNKNTQTNELSTKQPLFIDGVMQCYYTILVTFATVKRRTIEAIPIKMFLVLTSEFSFTSDLLTHSPLPIFNVGVELQEVYVLPSEIAFTTVPIGKNLITILWLKSPAAFGLFVQTAVLLMVLYSVAIINKFVNYKDNNNILGILHNVKSKHSKGL